jgi:hypothetical protein
LKESAKAKTSQSIMKLTSLKNSTKNEEQPKLKTSKAEI